MDRNPLVKLVPSRNDAILAYRVFDRQTILVDLAQGTLNTLNTTATRVWQLISERMTIEKFNEIPCGAGHMSCYISPYGMITPCVQVPIECGSLRERRFSEIWSNSLELRAFRAIRLSDMPKCTECELFAYCRLCPGLNLVETGSLFTPPPRVCKEAEQMKTLNKKRR
jgi:radical SAM protein with 4Fe4S-binding SPASM domain